MNVEVDPRRALPAETRLRLVDCDIHPMLRRASDIKAFLAPEWHAYHDRYGNFLQQPYADANPYPEGDAGAFPPRRLAGEWRAARQRPRPAPQPAPRRARHRVRHPPGAVADRGAAAQPRLRGGAVPRGERLAGGRVHLQGAAAARLHHGEPGGRAGGGGRDRALRRARRLRAGHGHAAQHASRWGAGATGRSSPRRRSTTSPLGCHVGGLNGYAVASGAGHPSFYAEEHHSNVFAMEAMVTSPGLRGRAGALPAPALRRGRGGAGLGAAARLAAGRACGSASATSCRR